MFCIELKVHSYCYLTAFTQPTLKLAADKQDCLRLIDRMCQLLRSTVLYLVAVMYRNRVTFK